MRVMSRSPIWRMDFRVLLVMAALMMISLTILSSYTTPGGLLDSGEGSFLTPVVKVQLRWFAMGLGVFMACATFDYNKLREWTWLLYALMLLALIGLFFTDAIQRVHRWYRVPLLGISFQPSEFAKLTVVLALSWFLERRRARSQEMSTAFFGLMIVGIPFLLILKQPDLGTAMVLCPVTLVMFYLGGFVPWLTRLMLYLSLVVLALIAVIFLGLVSHETARPYATKVLKDYQYDRLDPNAFHQRAAQTAIALGGMTGVGWRKSEFTAGGWLPKPETDSVFPAFGEEFGFLGLALLMALFYALIYFSFQVVAVAKDEFGRLLAAGVSTYLAVHVLVNVGMMTGFAPVTGVPLILVTYGGSSVFFTMAALGILQSIYSRRFMF